MYPARGGRGLGGGMGAVLFGHSCRCRRADLQTMHMAVNTPLATWPKPRSIAVSVGQLPTTAIYHRAQDTGRTESPAGRLNLLPSGISFGVAAKRGGVGWTTGVLRENSFTPGPYFFLPPPLATKKSNKNRQKEIGTEHKTVADRYATDRFEFFGRTKLFLLFFFPLRIMFRTKNSQNIQTVEVY